MYKKLSDAHPSLKFMLSDIANQPNWRGDAAVCMAWRDNRQWTKEQAQHIESLGINPMHVNLIASSMDAVTGYEAKHQVDWMVSAASEEHADMAEAINHELNDEMRLAKANHSCSQAYDSQAAVGVGWVYVGRNQDPMNPAKVMTEDVHRDEIFWDMRARSEDLRYDCRWIARRRFFDRDNAKQFLGGKYDALVDTTMSDWQTHELSDGDPYADLYAQMIEYTEPIELVLDNTGQRPMVAIYEVYYKVYDKRDLIRVQDGPVMEFNQDNPVHLEILISGWGTLTRQVPMIVCRKAWFCGPHLIHDGPTDQPHNEFPFVPFFGPREDALNTPHGLIARMMGPQEQYNRAVIEIQRILRQRLIIKDKDALEGMTDQQAIFEINRSDGVINKKRGREFQLHREWEKLAALEGICQRARDEINAASGVYQTFQGQTETEQSGVAVESIAELGAQSLGKVNANYQLGRKLVGDLAFYITVDSLGQRKKLVNIPQEVGQNKKQVVINDGMTNQLALMRADVALQDIHTSAGYKQHTHMRLTNVMQNIPDEYKGVLLPFWLETSEMPKKDQAIKMINKMLGYEEDEQKRAAQEEAQAKEAEQQKQLEIRKFVAEIEEMEAGTIEKQASAKDKQAQAQNHTADALKKRIETAQLIREFKFANQAGAMPGAPAAGPPKSTATDHRGALPPGASGANSRPAGNAPTPPHPGSR